MQRQMLVILARLDGIAVRESVFAAEVEIAVKHPITTEEVKREMDELLFLAERDLIQRDRDSFDETLWSITQKGELALKGL